jgi:hypothetical protein
MMSFDVQILFLKGLVKLLMHSDNWDPV